MEHRTMLQVQLSRSVRALREAARVVLLAWLAAACATWTPRRLDANPGGVTVVPGVVRVTLRDSSRFELRDVRVTTDTLVGFDRIYGHSNRVQVATSTVASIQQREVSPGRTLLLVVALGAAAVGVAAAIFVSEMGPGY